MRILITGSRDWDDANAIAFVMEGAVPLMARDVTVVHGDARGADRIAGAYAEQAGWKVEKHPANWNLYGKKAGFIRNKEMVDLGADICLAFIKNNSRGATMCAQLAREAGIPVRVIARNDG